MRLCMRSLAIMGNSTLGQMTCLAGRLLLLILFRVDQHLPQTDPAHCGSRTWFVSSHVEAKMYYQVLSDEARAVHPSVSLTVLVRGYPDSAGRYSRLSLGPGIHSGYMVTYAALQ